MRNANRKGKGRNRQAKLNVDAVSFEQNRQERIVERIAKQQQLIEELKTDAANAGRIEVIEAAIQRAYELI